MRKESIAKPKLREETSGGRTRHLSLLGLLLGGGGGGLNLGRGDVLVDGVDGDLRLGLGLDEGDLVGEGVGGAHAALGVVGAHDLDLDTKDTLTEEDVTDGVVDEVDRGLTGVDEETVGELHGLGTGSTELTRDNDLATLGARLHNVTEDTVARTAHGKATKELVAEGLGLGDGGETTVLDLLGVELKRVLGEAETLLDESLELTDAAALVTKNLLGVGGTDDDLGARVGDADLTSGVALLGELASAEALASALVPGPGPISSKNNEVGSACARARTHSSFRFRSSSSAVDGSVVALALTRTRQAQPGKHRRRRTSSSC